MRLVATFIIWVGSLFLALMFLEISDNKILDKTVAAIAMVESGGFKNPENAVGDNGRALGIYQLHRDYVIDAMKIDRSIKGTYEDIALDPVRSKLCVIAYLKHYGIKCGIKDSYRLARIHNGGPRGYLKDSTAKYADRVMLELAKLQD